MKQNMKQNINMPLISIVIPAFNVEEYVEQCIKSINDQSFQDYEVIIVDDGSTDNTVKIITENITDKYKVIKQKNEGAGKARNTGIKYAKGKYITFMDSDDFFYDNNCLKNIADVLELGKYDMVTYRMVRYYQKSKKMLIEDVISFDSKQKNNIEEYLKTTIKNSRLSVSPCDKIIRTSIIKNNNIYFDDMIMLEDIDWSLRLYNYVNDVMVLNEPIYVYRKERIGSTTSFYTQKKVLACVNFIVDWCRYCKQENTKKTNLYLDYIAYQYLILLAAINKKNCNKKTKSLLKEYKWLIDYELNFKLKKTKKMYHMLGYNNMIIILKIYMYLKNMNLVLIR